MYEIVGPDGRTVQCDHRYQNAGVQLTLRPGDPSVHAYHIANEQWRRMVETGILGKYDPCELLEGAIVAIPGPGSAAFFHVRHVLNDLLRKLLPQHMLSIQCPQLTLGTSEPIAELAVFRGSFDDYCALGRFPNGTEIALVVEVGELALESDRIIKQRIYSAAGIPEYWIINLAERKLEVHRKPAAAVGQLPARYESLDVFGPESTLDVVLDGTKVGTISVGDVLP